MKAFDEADRIANFKRTTHCQVCRDDAQVTVATHTHCDAEYDEYGPCPFCARGLRLEHGHWPDGYWQGRDLPDHIVEAWVTAQQPYHVPSQAENLAAIRALAAGLLSTVDREIEPPWGIQPRPAGERFFESAPEKTAP